MYDSYYTPDEPSDAEYELFDQVDERHPEWTNQQIWDEVDRIIEEREEQAAEAYAERHREDY